ncbi:MAG: FHA domain-containing protein [Acidobacteriota bacterium]|nr:FHA domain-containing protein [Acidobacteriota bacterium]
MDSPRLKLSDGTEFEFDSKLTTLGRTPDNDVSFPDDTNVSRYHAEIEDRGDGEFWLFDLQSSNGTTLNGEKVVTEKPLFDGDVIVLGGSTELEFTSKQNEDPDASDEEEDDKQPGEDSKDDPKSGQEDAPAAAPPNKKFMYLMVFAGIAIGLAIVLAVAAIIYSLSDGTSGSDCSAAAEIVAPENGDILSEATAVEIEVEDASCVAEAVFLIGGEEFARTSEDPFQASLDPDRFPKLSDGRDKIITIELIDEEGVKIPQNAMIAILIETIETETPEPIDDPEKPGTGPEKPAVPQPTARTSLIDTQQMAKNILPQFTVVNQQYNTNNQQFLAEVAKMTAEYRSEGFYERASKYRDVINYQYLREQNLDPALGYILAMSRTKFVPATKAEGAGLWKMNNQLVLDNNYNGICGAETIASETQKCAAIASSSYLKDIILNVFSGDLIYGVAAFGMDKQDAAEWNASLPTDPAARADFWNVIRDPKRREEVTRFFAAAIVLENPKKFDLTRDKPISTLYPAYTE